MRSRGPGPSCEAAANLNPGPGTLAPGLPSFLSDRPPPPLPLPSGKIHVALLLDSGRDDAVSVWMLTELRVRSGFPFPRFFLNLESLIIYILPLLLIM